jgi:hypothetical protein
VSELKPKREAPVVTRQEEIALAQLTLLMRIYDVQMALLTEVNENRANEVYAAHEEGHTFNPAIWIAEAATLDEPGESVPKD